MKKNLFTAITLFILICILHIAPVNAQIQYGGEALSTFHSLSPPSAEPLIFGLNPLMERQRSELSGVYRPGEAAHAGFAVEASIDPASDGQWDIVDAWHIWRVVILSPGALASGINFSVFEMHPDARLFVYDPEKKVVLGAFDHRNNNEARVFSTAVIPGEYIVLEYYEPWYPGKPEQIEWSLLEAESMIHITDGGINQLLFTNKDIGNAGDCQVNINCEEGDDWQKEKRGIARMLMRVGTNFSWCTGSLINNTAQDGTPYFLSAEHCGRNASLEDMLYWQFYFNLEHQGCLNEGMPTYNMVYGAHNKATGPLSGGSDFRLLELHTTPPEHWKPYWNGWDRSNEGSSSGAGIHHPRGDVKKISTYQINLVSSAPNVSGQQMAANSAWRVNWFPTINGHGVTEGGSSGSPIFNSEKKIIGTLTGGSTTCANPYGFDFYGKLWYHWDKNGAQNHNRLSSHLDPLETGAMAIDGYDPYLEATPPPGFLKANLAESNQAGIRWFAPGTAPNPDGWYSYTTSYTHLTWVGRERTTVFDPPALGLNYPVHLKKISHFFTEHTNHPWPSDQFRFRIYDADGQTLLYESGILFAQDMHEYIYELVTPITFHDYFYVAVRTEDSSGHPSTLMNRVNLAQGYSFYGSEGSWIPHNDGLDGSFAHLTAIYLEGDIDKTHQGRTHSNLHGKMLSHPPLDNHETTSIRISHSGNIPDLYRIFRNGQNVYTEDNPENMHYTDMLPGEGFFRYHAIAVYDNVVSAPSNTAYLLNAVSCGESISEWPYSEAFDIEFDPECWIIHGLQENSWMLTEGYSTGTEELNPFQGDQYFMITGNGTTEQDDWLIVPGMDFSGINDPALRFVFNHFLEEAENISYLALMVSDNNNSFEKLWDSRHHPDFGAGDNMLEWLPVTLNLSRYGGSENVRLAFQFKGNMEGLYAIDHIEILHANTLMKTLNATVTPQFAGTMSGQGSYLAGETVRLRAYPNITFDFESWIQGAMTLGTERELVFNMPASNISITARFSSTTSIEELFGVHDNLLVYPNPARNIIHVRFDHDIQPAVVNLLNNMGQVIQSQTFHNVYKGMEVSLPTKDLPDGLYFIQIRSKRQSRTVKLILSK